MQRLDDHLEKLHPFVTIADLGSLHRAAARLRTSQPALTQMIKTMEGHLDVQLFSRTSRGMALTDAGEKLYRFAKTLLRQTAEFHFSEDSLPGTVRIATYESLADLICLKFEEFPAARHYQFFCNFSGLKLVDQLVAGETDYIVLAEPPKVPGVKFEKLVDARYGLYATRKYLARRGRVTLAAIRRDPLIYVPGSVSSSAGIIDRFIAAAGLGQDRRLTVNSYVIAKTLTLQHHGVGILVDALVAHDLADKKIVEIDAGQANPTTSIYLGFREGQDARSEYVQVRRALRSAIGHNLRPGSGPKTAGVPPRVEVSSFLHAGGKP